MVLFPRPLCAHSASPHNYHLAFELVLNRKAAMNYHKEIILEVVFWPMCLSSIFVI